MTFPLTHKITERNHIFTLRYIYCDAYDTIIDIGATYHIFIALFHSRQYWLCVPPNIGALAHICMANLILVILSQVIVT